MSEKSNVSNLGLAAYLDMKGFKLADTPKREPDGKFAFSFDIQASDLEKISYEYLSGDFAKYDNALVRLKKLLPRY